MAASVPPREPTHAQVRAQAEQARTTAIELRRESRELIALCVERRVVADDRSAQGSGDGGAGANRGSPA